MRRFKENYFTMDKRLLSDINYTPLSRDMLDYVEEYQLSRAFSRYSKTTNTTATRVRSPNFLSTKSISSKKKKTPPPSINHEFKLTNKEKEILVKYNFEDQLLNETHSKDYIRAVRRK